MTEQNAIVKIDDSTLENVLISGDLSKLTSPQRVQYYKKVCDSLGLNPFTKPFEYITLNNKLTLYAKKDATDQLRSIQGVSIDDVDIQETATQFIVKVKGHNRDGRQDVEVGVVNKSDMNGNLANAQMKAVTKAKRRLTLSLCGLGWLDETEIETIPSAKPANIQIETGEIINGEEGGEPKPKPKVTRDAVKPERPYPPEILKKGIEQKGTQFVGKTASEKQRGLVASLLNVCFAPSDDADKIRHSVQDYLYGAKVSMKNAPDGFVLALIDWLKPVEDTGGAWYPSDMAVKEAQLVWKECQLAAGQTLFDMPPTEQ